ncbi:hypothetical protein Ade02nite_40980 [Paractinoplanes deccanensis]|uniref:Uncharacterized protein n=1 Tax=Paractinoplanes deccanensis TaxID=113561 RepID=A0ABQ3Y645_9ACTN|nr:hypothetical protein [Actinoplanes deccanensis]GID75457.1 hypothetical protein Ade02nite_40980 [Actinoplanes deccanensis]
MRLPLAACAAALVLAGCSGSPSGQTPAAGTPAAPAGTPATGPTAVPPAPVDPSVAASADAALSGDTEAICAQAARVNSDFGKTFIADLKLQIDAASKGGAAKQQADQKIARDVSNYSYALADMAKLTTDPVLKKALTDMSQQVTALKGDLTKINAEKMSQLTGTLDKACGKG